MKKLGRSENQGLPKRELSWVRPKLRLELCACKIPVWKMYRKYGEQRRNCFHWNQWKLFIPFQRLTWDLLYYMNKYSIFPKCLDVIFFRATFLQLALHLAIYCCIFWENKDEQVLSRYKSSFTLAVIC